MAARLHGSFSATKQSMVFLETYENYIYDLYSIVHQVLTYLLASSQLSCSTHLSQGR